MLDPLFAGHCTDWTAFPLDNGGAHVCGRTLVGKVAIGVEEPHPVVDLQGEEDAGDAARQEFPHGEHLAVHEERRQDVEHVIMLDLGKLEPLPAIEAGIGILETIGALRVAIEHAEHLPAVGNTLVDFADRRRGVHWRAPSASSDWSATHPRGSPSSSALPDPSPAAASPSGRVKCRRSRAKLHT